MLNIGAVVLASLVVAAPAFGGTATEKKLEAEVAALQKKIPAMQKQITALQKQVKTLQKNDKTLGNVLSAEIDYSICSNAATADALQQTWATLNISSTGAIFGAAESAVNDTGSCQSWKVTRQASGVPNLGVFKALLTLWS
jgi:Skp family chaperone for outer membrane proteins